MKKFLTIGRNPACDICIPDSTDVVSREHAILEIGRGGKYFLIDKSRNGTYVNGIKMTSNEKIPVTREDVISFAHVRDLDWALVPKNNAATIWALSILAAVVILGGGGWGISALVRSSQQNRIEISGNSQRADQWDSPDSRPEGPAPGKEEKEAQDSTEQKRQAVKPAKPTAPSATKKQKEGKEQQEKQQPEVIDAIY